ncbi:FixH family protein [Porticoccus sp.]
MQQSRHVGPDGLDKQPWYRQSWLWFLIALPGTVVVASLFTVYIAFKNADTLVVDSYYRKGLAINQVLEQDKLAARLGVTAEVRLDAESGELFVTLNGIDTPPEQVTLLLLHPTDESRDRTLLLSPITAGHYRTDLDQQLQYRYYLRLFPEPQKEWRLAGELDFSSMNQVMLSAQ